MSPTEDWSIAVTGIWKATVTHQPGGKGINLECEVEKYGEKGFLKCREKESINLSTQPGKA